MQFNNDRIFPSQKDVIANSPAQLSVREKWLPFATFSVTAIRVEGLRI